MVAEAGGLLVLGYGVDDIILYHGPRSFVTALDASEIVPFQ